MVVHGDELLEAVIIIAKNEQWQASVGYSVATGMLNGLSCVVGFALLGLPGSAIGVGISATGAYWWTRKKYMSVFDVLKAMEPKEKEKLKELLYDAFKDIELSDLLTVADFVLTLTNNPARMKAIQALATKFAVELLRNQRNKPISSQTNKSGLSDKKFNVLDTSTGRMNPHCLGELPGKNERLLKNQDSNVKQAIAPEDRLLGALRNQTSQASYADPKYNTGMSRELSSTPISGPDLWIDIKMPHNDAGWQKKMIEISNRWNFPNCLNGGIYKSLNSGTTLSNNHFSTVLSAAVDAFYVYSYVKRRMDSTVRDNAFQSHEHKTHNSTKNGITKKKRKNINRERRVVEKAICVLAKRFPALNQLPLQVKIGDNDITDHICYALHDFVTEKELHFLIDVVDTFY